MLMNVFLTKCIIPAAVNHTDIKMETNCANRIELDVFNTFKYCKISGTVIRRSALRKRRPVMNINVEYDNSNAVRFTYRSKSAASIWIQRTGVL